MQHSWHQASCTFHRTLNTRHDQYLEAIAKTARKDLGLLALTGEYLNKDYKSRRSTDLYVVFPGSVDEMPVSMDYTCVCPFLPTYRTAARKNFEGMLLARGKQKSDHHGPYCKDMGRIFVPAPGSTTGATGTDEYWAFMHRIFARAITRDQIAGGSGFGIQEQRRELLAQLHAIIIRYTAQHTVSLSGRRPHAPTR